MAAGATTDLTPGAAAGQAWVEGDDGVARWPWESGDPLNVEFHDTGWGVAVHGESPLLERITLEAFQSGLSWLTILRKRPDFRRSFAGFDADVIASFDDDRVEKLMADRSEEHTSELQSLMRNSYAVLCLKIKKKKNKEKMIEKY